MCNYPGFSKYNFRRLLMQDQQLAIIRNLLTNQFFGVLATKAEPFPHCSLVAFSVNPDFSAIYFCTSRATRKFANLSANSNVSLLIDNRNNEAADLRHAAVLTATGEARELDQEARSQTCSKFVLRHPDLKKFISLQDTAICTISVHNYFLVYDFQEVLPLTPTQLINKTNP